MRAVLIDGSQQIIDFGRNGDLVGFGLDQSGRADYGVECLTAVRANVYDRALLLRLCTHHGSIANWVDAQRSAVLARAYGQIANMGCRRGTRKVAALLYDLAHREAGLAPCCLPITQHHLAEALGITNVYVSRMLQPLLANGTVQMTRNGIEIVDPAALARAADDTMPMLERCPQAGPCVT